MPHDHDEQDPMEHPQLSPAQDTEQRGDAPDGAIGHTDPPKATELDPDWKPDGQTTRDAKKLIGELGRERRPRREDVYPYLVIRAYSPGDRGARPTWPTIPCWESPDIALIDASYAGPFHPSKLVASPIAGRSYRVFVRVWNLGLMAAVGVHVRAWFVDPGFFGGDSGNPAYQPKLIGGAMVNLEDRTHPGAMAVVELDQPWTIPTQLTGHECLMASASCPLDPWSGALDANHDRHVGQRNLTILAPAADAKSLFGSLGALVGKGATLELVHGGAAVTPLLQAIGGRARTELGVLGKLAAPEMDRLRRGIPMGAQRHLLTVAATERGVVVADSERLWQAAVEAGILEHGVGEDGNREAHPFARTLATRRVLEALGPDRWDTVGMVLDGSAEEALLAGLARLWDLPDFSGTALAGALADGPGAHLLRFVHTGPSSDEKADRLVVGGYSIIAVGG
jgi:hypothetical protein